MHSLAWDDRFLTGLTSVDEQHRGLVERINAFGEQAARSVTVPRETVAALLDDLSAYAASHFADEINLLVEAGLDPRFLDLHREQHARFVDEVGRRRADALDGDEAGRALLTFLIRWLAGHIVGTDQLAARQVALVRAGEAPEVAYARASKGAQGTHGLLSDAMDDLLQVIAERNRELETLNLSLEKRVSERTADLQRALADLKQTQQQLVEAAKLASVGQLASGVAHEINNPLAAVLANLRALEGSVPKLLSVIDAYQSAEGALADPARARVGKARQEADLDFLREDLPALLGESGEALSRVQAIVRGLKEFSRVEAAAWERLDLRQALETARKLIPDALWQGVRFEAAYGRVPPIPAQDAALGQALLALLHNAVLAVRDRPAARTDEARVSVRTAVEGERALVEVADTGVGMSEEVTAHLFEPFFTTRLAGQGVGLGLSSSWAMAQRHGGALEFETRPGAGSLFRLWLPLQQPERESTGTPAPSNPYNDRKTYGLRAPGGAK
ncbi:MAG: hemerythrin domain-containing protein [Myxococcales bacterium]